MILYHASGEEVEFPEIRKSKYTKDFSWGFYCTNNYDIVEGPMADDTVWNYVNDFLAGEISRNIFWDLAKFKYPTHQISFHTLKALDCLKFEGSEIINE